MPLSDDQKALLRLLAQREEGYGDIAALMGLSVEQVRGRVKEALVALDEESSAAGGSAAGPVVGRSSSSSQAAGEEPHPTPPAEETPRAPRPHTPDRPRDLQEGPPLSSSAPGRRREKRPALRQGRRRLAELIGGAVVVLLLILFATGAIDIGGDDSGSDDGAASTGGPLAGQADKLTQAALEPVGGGGARGRALFGRLGKNVVLQVVADGLEPAGGGESYAVWLYRSPKLALRVGATKVGESGRLAVRLPVPAEVLALVANGSFTEIRLSRTSEAAYRTEIAAAKRQQRLPRYTGETVLSGEIVGPLAESG